MHTIAFVGRLDDLLPLAGYAQHFKDNQWGVIEFTDIEQVLEHEHVDVIFVWAYYEKYIRSYVDKLNHIPSIWCVLSSFYSTPPRSETVLVYGAAVSQFTIFKAATNLVQRTNGQ
jgi:hypothetical protein